MQKKKIIPDVKICFGSDRKWILSFFGIIRKKIEQQKFINKVLSIIWIAMWSVKFIHDFTYPMWQKDYFKGMFWSFHSDPEGSKNPLKITFYFGSRKKTGMFCSLPKMSKGLLEFSLQILLSKSKSCEYFGRGFFCFRIAVRMQCLFYLQHKKWD